MSLSRENQIEVTWTVHRSIFVGRSFSVSGSMGFACRLSSDHVHICVDFNCMRLEPSAGEPSVCLAGSHKENPVSVVIFADASLPI